MVYFSFQTDVLFCLKTHLIYGICRGRTREKIVCIPPNKKSHAENNHRAKREDHKDKRSGSFGEKSHNTTGPAIATTGTVATEVISPSNWRKVKHDFSEVSAKSNSKKNHKELDHKNDRRPNNNINSSNNNKNGNTANRSIKNDSRSKKHKEGTDDLWDMPTGLSSEESQGLSEREMFELERKKFLALRQQPAGGGVPSREGNYHTESDAVMDNMKAEQEQKGGANDGGGQLGEEVTGRSLSFQINAVARGSEGVESGIRTYTAPDVMKKGGGGADRPSGEDMAWLGAMLTPNEGEEASKHSGGGGGGGRGGRSGSTDQDFFSHFLSDPVMTTPLTPPFGRHAAPTSPDSFSLPHGAQNGGGASRSSSSSKSSRLGSLLGIPLTPDRSQPSEPAVSDIKELNLSFDSMTTQGNEGCGHTDSAQSQVQGASHGHGHGHAPGHPKAANQKSRDLLATLGFSPPRTPSHPPRFHPPPAPQHMQHQHMQNMQQMHQQHIHQQHMHHEPMQQHLQQQPPQVVHHPSHGGGTDSKTKDLGAQFVFQDTGATSPGITTPVKSSASDNSISVVSSGGASKRSNMSASSRLQLQRMKQGGGGGGRKKIEVSSLFNKAPSASAPTTITSSITAPLSSTTTPAPADKPNPAIKVSTNSKGASLLMQLKK